MVQVQSEALPYQSQFQTFRGSAGGPAWLRQLRDRGMAAFEASGFPSNRHEDWKYTNVTPIVRARFTPGWDCASSVASASEVKNLIIDQPDWTTLVFINGLFSNSLSSVSGLSDSLVIGNLAESAELNPELVRRYLTQMASLEDGGFTALNTAFLRDGAFIYIPDGTTLEKPIQLIFVSTSDEAALVTHPRNLVVLGQHSSATIVEDYITLGAGTHFTNTVTEVMLGVEAQMEYYKFQRESDEAFHVGTTQIDQGKRSRVFSFFMGVGARLARNNLNVIMDGDGGECNLDGLYVTGGQQHIDNHTMVDHVGSYTRSRQLYKGILDGESRAVFNGKVVARRDTHQVDAHQINKNLLLSNQAEVNTKPQLEIFADDLKCSHGATVGQLDEDAIFYMNSRGIGRLEASRFLSRGFAQDVISSVKTEEVGRIIEAIVESRLRDETDSLTE